MKPFLSDKCTLACKISPENKDNVITDDEQLASMNFHDFHENVLNDLRIKE